MLEKIKKYEYLMRSSFFKRKPEIIKQHSSLTVHRQNKPF